MAKELWEIKYRPKTVEEYVFQDSNHEELVTKFISEKSIPHLLLNGHRGTGKTSLALLLKNALGISDSDFMAINASDENGVDDIRNKIKGFISTYAEGDTKLVLLDEADYLTHNAQALLRSMMEEYADNVRFILSCNKGHKIIPELKSRCTEITFKRMDKDKMLMRLCEISIDEEISTTEAVLKEYIEAAYPDMRKAIKMMQYGVKDGVLMSPDVIAETDESNFSIVMAMEAGKYASIRDILATVQDDDWEALYTFFYTELHGIGKFKDEKKWKQGIVILADHLYRHASVADPEINAMAMFIRLGEV